MRRKNIFYIVAFATVSLILLMVSDIFAGQPEIECQNQFKEHCVVSPGTCYFFGIDADDICIFDFSIYN